MCSGCVVLGLSDVPSCATGVSVRGGMGMGFGTSCCLVTAVFGPSSSSTDGTRLQQRICLIKKHQFRKWWGGCKTD